MLDVQAQDGTPYGLVEFETGSEALHAISLLSNSILNGRKIVVREDRTTVPAAVVQQPYRGGAGGGGRAPGVSQGTAGRQVRPFQV